MSPSPTITPGSGSVNHSQYSFDYDHHGTTQTVNLTSAHVNGTNTEPTCGISGGWTIPFKKAPTSLDEATEQHAVYPSLLNSESVVTVQSDRMVTERVNVAISNSLGQIIYQESTSIEAEGKLQLPAGLFEKGINFISIKTADGVEVVSTKVLKE